MSHVDEGACIKSRGKFAFAGVQKTGKTEKGKRIYPQEETATEFISEMDHSKQSMKRCKA